MKSNSLDGEFLRLLSGTHHISEAFRRAGLVDGDDAAWMVHLGGDEDSNFSSHADAMSFELTGERPSPELADMLRLGITEGEGEDVAIGHIHLADMR
jgi:tRNA threonylcarbamoyladenosine modification (KEOPS) complex Cgi121 subunit